MGQQVIGMVMLHMDKSLNSLIEAVRQPSKAPSCHSEPFDRLRINSAKNLINLDTYAFEILRLTPQNDIVGQPRFLDLVSLFHRTGEYRGKKW